MGDFDPSEAEPDPEALADPVGERNRCPLPFLLRKYPDRVLVLAAARCFFYCRFCFRRGEAPARRRQPGREEWEGIYRWLGDHPEVEEVILSGGDPLTLPDRDLHEIGRRLASLPSLRRWRIHTRAPVVLPRRLTPGLVETLANVALPLRVVLHVNHPAELWSPLEDAVRRLQRAGVEVLSQTVLLAGVNDRAETLLELFRGLAAWGVGARYLHHPDRAEGNRGFRVEPHRGLALARTIQSCGKIPPYVLDAPDGSGKRPVQDMLVAPHPDRNAPPAQGDDLRGPAPEPGLAHDLAGR
jgi:lysine 2,3-aminomutase